jgi:hypothetical protein
MELPNYFLADLPDRSALTPQLITDACHTLKRNRQKFLATQTTESLINIFAKLGKEWLDPEFPFRKMALELGPAQTGFGVKTLAAGLDHYFKQLTTESLEALVIQDLGSLTRLDQFTANNVEARQDRSSITRGPELLVQITGGVLPNAPSTSIILGLLARSAQFIKCASGTSFLPRMFAHSLYSAQPKLGACLELAEWKGGNRELEDALFAEAPCVTATGSDESLAEIRNRLPANVRFVGYSHKLSLAYIARESLEKSGAEKIASAITDDVIAWNQLGCLSPQAVYVETGAEPDSHALAAAIANELEAREQTDPRGPVSPEISAAISTRRMFYEVRAASGPDTQIWSSAGSTAWTVVHETSDPFQTSCLNRFLFVKPVANFDDFLTSIELLQGKISTVGLAAPMARVQQIAPQLSNVGVTRICRIGSMQNPPFTWRHDGRPSLGELITWTDLEF